MKINSRLTILFLIVSIIPLIVAIILAYITIQNTLTEEVVNHLQSLARIQESRVQSIIDQNLERLKLVASRTQLRVSLNNFNQDPQPDYQTRMNTILLDALDSIDSFEVISVLNMAGTVVASTEAEQIGLDLAAEPFFQEGQQQSQADNLFLDRSGELKIYLSGPLYLEEELIGVVVIESRVDNLLALVQDYAGLGDTGETYLVKATADGQAQILTPLRFAPQATLTRVVTGSANQVSPAIQALTGESQLLLEGVDYNQQSVIAAIEYIENVDWGIIVKINRVEAFAPLNQLLIRALIIGTVTVVVVIFLAIFVARQFSRPITNLIDAALKISAGDTQQQQIEQPKIDELAKLATAFNQMMTELHQRTQTEARLRGRVQQTMVEYNQFIEQVTAGNLTSRLQVATEDDDLAMLGHNLNNMVARLAEVTRQIREATTNISSAATEILSATKEQSSGAHQQSAAITQTTTTISQVKTVGEQVFNKAEAVADRAYRTDEISKNGQEAVEETINSMLQIRDRVSGIAENILALSQQTQQIGEITTTVNEIASQSNLLALNASVEAARAGEHGKGFAVVAVEVRNLAEQSKQATTQVKSILNEVQQATNSAVMATEEGTKGVDVGVELTENTGHIILRLAQSITESADLARQIVASLQQQTAGIEQIVIAMENISQATQQNLASVRQTEHSAQLLTEVAQQLDSMVAQYQLDHRELS